ncbi:MAG: tetratricopeptide repeat protein [Verrucomicrobia bacterium]|nr:tetratricopeptide repeat protein [Verrucomicrobiota bacterium]
MIDHDLLTAYLEDALAPEVRAQVEAQLAQDAEALGFLAGQRKMDRVLRSTLRPQTQKQRVKQSILAAVRASAPEELRARVLEATTVERATPAKHPSAGPWEAFGQLIVSTIQRFKEPPTPWFSRYGVAAAAALALALGAWLYFRPAPLALVAVGKFTTVIGTPTVHHAGKPSALSPQPSTMICLGDRIETGDADKAEIQFLDGTTLRLNFNTTLEIPNPKSEIRNPKSQSLRPSEIHLVRGHVWAKVQPATPINQFAVHTPAATATVRGTEFGLTVQRAQGSEVRGQKPESTGTGSQSAIPNPQSAIPLVAVLTVKEGAVEFSNSFGRVLATNLTESLAKPDAAPTPPRRLQTLKVVRLTGSHSWVVTTSQPSWQEAADRMVVCYGWVGLKVMDVANEATGQNAVHVAAVEPASPSASAGLQAGDILKSLNGQAATNAVQVQRAILATADAPLRLTFLRAGAEQSASVTTRSRNCGYPSLGLLPGMEFSLYEPTRLAFAGKVAESRAALEHLRRIGAGPAALNNLGVLAETDDQLGDAIQAYQQAVQAKPQVALYHYNLGWALRSIGNFERALEEFETAWRLAPRWPPAQQRLADIYALVSRHDDALRVVEQALTLDPLAHGTWELKAQILLEQHHPDDAYLAVRQALDLEPRCAVAHGLLADIHHDRRELEEAEKTFRQALALDPTEAKLHLNLGNVLRDRGKLDDAEKSYRRAIELNPKFALAHAQLGKLYSDRHEWDKAEPPLRKAIGLSPEYASPYFTLGEVLYERQQLDEAEKLSRQAIELEPTNPAPYETLAKIHQARGQPEEAEKLTRKAAELSAAQSTAPKPETKAP